MHHRELQAGDRIATFMFYVSIFAGHIISRRPTSHMVPQHVSLSHVYSVKAGFYFILFYFTFFCALVFVGVIAHAVLPVILFYLSGLVFQNRTAILFLCNFLKVEFDGA